MCERLSLDTALAVAFDLVPPAVGFRVLKGLDALSSPFGHRIVWPPYGQTAPADYPVGQYHNAGSWPWLTGWLALAWAELGEPALACDLVSSAVSWDEATVHEWIDTKTGQRHHPSFVTGAAALAWAYGTAVAKIEGAAA
jgi:glycogen debranching enzyme